MSKLIYGKNDLATYSPAIASQWDYEKNQGLTPEMFTYGSKKRVWWKGNCGHNWEASIKARVNGTNCPICDNKIIISGENDLASTNSLLAAEWHPLKNADLLPSMVSAGSNKKVWWRGKCGHEWIASIKSRNSGRGCPICSGKILLKGYNDLATVAPIISTEWDFDRNAPLLPTDVIANSHTRVWWRCQQGHSWEATPNHRVSKERNCPFCCHNPKALIGENDLGTLFPILAEEWDKEKNYPLTPFDVTAHSSKPVWWRCRFGHEWKTSPNHRTDGSGCPKCAYYTHSSFPEQAIFYYIKKSYPDAVNGYTDVFPSRRMELDIYIPSEKTGIEYDGIAFHSSSTQKERETRKYTICKQQGIKLIRIRENHQDTEYSHCDILFFTRDTLENTIRQLSSELKLFQDINIGRDYSHIQKQYLFNIEHNSLAFLFPKIAEQWDREKNGSISPEMFSAHTNIKVWWRCKNGHSWKTAIDSRTNGTNCPYCSNNKTLSGFNDLATKRPDLKMEWNWDKNGDLTPNQVTPGSGKKAWWTCKTCGFIWKAEISSRNKGAGCPQCALQKQQKK